MNATDDFNRADNASLGASWGTRQAGPEAFKIVSNQAVPSNFQDSTEFYSAVAWSHDQWSEIVIASVVGTGNEGGIGVCVRCDTSPSGAGAAAINLYWAVVDNQASNNISVARWIANSYTLLGQRTQAVSAGDKLKLEARGNILRVYINGVQIGADFTDNTSFSLPGAPGLALTMPVTSGVIESWEGGDWAAVQVPVTYSPQRFGPF